MSSRVLMILVLVGLLVVVGELDKVSGLTSADIVLLRWKEQDNHRLTMEKNLKKKPADMIKKSLKNTKKIRPSSSSAAAAPSQEFESSKRKVRKGSDPIHNRP